MKHFWTIGLLFLTMACGKEEFPLPANQSTQNNDHSISLSINSSIDLQIDQLESDPFKIVSATPYDEGFSIIVQYGGGCTDHDFTIFWNQLIAESFPPQATLTMTHDDHDDPCDAIVRDSLFVPYAQLIEDVEVFDPIFIHINNFSNDEEITVDSRAHLFTEAGCEIPVVARSVNCADGALGKFLFETEEKLAFNDLQIWLDIVELGENVAEVNLVEGQTYTMEVKPTFTREWWWDGTNCPSGLDSLGTVYPVKILCIQ